jgi:PIN domain nuclease of toxin-antitoxin system
MTDVVTDTHGLIWYLEDSLRLSAAARDAFDRCDRGEMLVYVPTICLVEIVYLQEKGRISLELMAKLNAELQAGGSGLSLCDLTPDIASAVARVPRALVPDMPDLIIAATALCRGLPLISRDQKIRLSEVETIW